MYAAPSPLRVGFTFATTSTLCWTCPPRSLKDTRSSYEPRPHGDKQFRAAAVPMMLERMVVPMMLERMVGTNNGNNVLRTSLTDIPNACFLSKIGFFAETCVRHIFRLYRHPAKVICLLACRRRREGARGISCLYGGRSLHSTNLSSHASMQHVDNSGGWGTLMYSPPP